MDLLHTKLDQLINWVNNYREEQLYMGLTCVNRIVIPRITNDVNRCIGDLDNYIMDLKDIVDRGYLEEYATDDNDCFIKDSIRFDKLKKSFKLLNNTILSFCPNSPRMAYNYRGEHITYTNYAHSYFCNTTATQLDLYGRESYPEDVQQLCVAFEKFFATLQKGFDLCETVKQKVKAIRDNSELSKKIYMDAYKEEVVHSLDIISSCLSINGFSLLDRFEEERKKGITEDELIAQLYHAMDKKEFRNHTISNELRKARSLGLQDEESILFKNVPVKDVLNLRKLIVYFDNIAYKKRGNILASACIAFLIEWLQIGEGKSRMFYSYFMKNYSGTFKIPTYTAVMKAYNNKLGKFNENGKKAYDDFVQKAQYYLSQISANEQELHQIQLFSML